MEMNRQHNRGRLRVIWPIVAAATMIGSVIWVSRQIGIGWV